MTLNKDGNIIDYKRVLTGTVMNCNGGRTPSVGGTWDAWISAEEDFGRARGRAWQVDPLGIRPPSPITLGQDGGIFEAFAYDDRNKSAPQFFLTEDDYYGAMQRFIPYKPDWSHPWEILVGDGTIDYLVLEPSNRNMNRGTFRWTQNKQEARRSAGRVYPNSEGVDVSGNKLFFVTKRFGHLFELDLDNGTYRRTFTSSGLFDGSPDQLQEVIGYNNEALLYFTEDGGERAGIHARNSNGDLFTILEGLYRPETTGLSFSPDSKRMYFAFQEDGLLFEVTRKDGLPFHAKSLNLKFHAYEGSTAVNRARRQLDSSTRSRHF